MRVSKAQAFAALPPPWPEDLRPRIRRELAAAREKLVVLDDDPTGTQTVYDVPVLTRWDVATLQEELARESAGCYLLTNSRSLGPEAARTLNQDIARNLQVAAPAVGRRFTLISRSDSTLRGHFPLETDTLSEVLGPFDATLLIPYFEAGGRYTLNGIHYVAEGDELVPAAETPFARDSVFGFAHSDLPGYVEEKTGGRVPAAAVVSIGLDDLRQGGPDAVARRLIGLPRGSVGFVEAADPRDLEVLVAALLPAEAQGRRFLFRTAAQFVAARLGLEPRPLWTPPAEARGAGSGLGGGLTVVGSHVPKTTAQLAALLKLEGPVALELSAAALLDPRTREPHLAQTLDQLDRHLAAGTDVVVYTSRDLITGASDEENLRIGRTLSETLVALVRGLESRPRYLVAKGGITSSDVATLGLGVRRAMVLGQILPGVPVWELGPETRFPGLPYVVFPGNVGGTDALAQAIQILTP